MRNNNEKNEAAITLRLTEEESYNLMHGQNAEWTGEEYELIGQLSTVVGTRKNQQDSCYVNVDGGTNAVAIVCDGMGGLKGGEIASQSAVQMFIEDFEEIRYTEHNFYSFFCNEMVRVDAMVADLENEQGELLSAGTTLSAVAVVDGYLQFISVGDSKIYIIRGNEMACLNREHNYLLLLNEQLLNGEITEEEYAREQKRGAALISYIGMGNVHLMDANPEPWKLENGDIIIVCSDGLYKALNEEQIYTIVKKNPINLEKTLQELQEEAHRSSPRVQDNTSIVMLSYRKKNI